MGDAPTMPTPKFINTGDWRDPDKMIERLKKDAEANPGAIVTGDHGAWSVCFSKGPPLGNCFSAKVHRSTTERDWTVLGRMAKRIGSPEGMMPETIAKDATATHYWIWDNEPETQKMVDMMMGKS